MAALRRHQLPRQHLAQRPADRRRNDVVGRVPPLSSSTSPRIVRATGAKRAGRRGLRARAPRSGDHVGRLEPHAARQEHGPVGRRLPDRERPARAPKSARGADRRPPVARPRDADRDRRSPERDRRSRDRHVRGTIDDITVLRRPCRSPRASGRPSRFTPDQVKELNISKPRLWWPYRMGEQTLYTLALDGGRRRRVSDRQQVRFGIQQMTSELTDKGHRLFKVNGKPILIRGGGWASDMLLRPASTERARGRAALRARDGPQHDPPRGQARERRVLRPRRRARHPGDARLVLLRSVGECGTSGTPRITASAPASLRDQILRLRNHPSVFVWLNGSDFPPPAKVEQAYLDVLEGAALAEADPLERHRHAGAGRAARAASRCAARTTTCRRPTGSRTRRTAARSASPPRSGRARRCRRSRASKRCCRPITSGRSTSSGRSTPAATSSRTSSSSPQALEARYGKATSVEDYARKAQALAYEGQRAMFEAFAPQQVHRRPASSSGCSTTPGRRMIWHLYDYYLRPGGGYFGTKKACEPLHVQYSYDDRSVAIVNDRHEAAQGADR